MIRKVHKIEDIENIFNEALEENAQSVAIIQTIPFQEGTEMLVCSRRNIKNKLMYYKKNYDENLNHKRNDRIRIVAAGYGDCDIWDSKGNLIVE